MDKRFKYHKLVVFFLSILFVFLFGHYSGLVNPALATCYCVHPGADACKCSAEPPSNATFDGNQDGVAVKCTSQEEANSTFEKKNPICGSASETIPYCAFKVGDTSDLTCWGTEFAAGSTNIPQETGGLINWNKPVDFNGFHTDNVEKILTCRAGNFCCARSDIQCDNSGVPQGGSCTPQDGPGNTRVCNNPVVPPPQGMACDQTVPTEFHSLRPYRGAFCTSAETVTACGNDLVLEKEFQLTPAGGRCTTSGDGSRHCEYEIAGLSNIQVSVPNGQLPIAGNTQLVKNSTNQTNQLDDKAKTNEYVSWYLNGTNFRAEDDPPDNNKALVDFAGPIKKLLPQSILYQKQIESISKIKTLRHDQIVVCANKFTGNPHACYDNGFISNLFEDSLRLSEWNKELSVFNDLLNFAVNAISNLLPFNIGQQELKDAIGKPWNRRIPPLESGKDMDDKPFTEITYRKAYQEWNGKTCAIITFPVVNIKQLVCVDNPFVPHRWSDLFPYVSLSSTEDLPGSISVNGSVGFSAAPMFPGANAGGCGGGPIGWGVPASQSVNLPDFIAGAGFIEHDLSTGEHIRFSGEGGSGPGSPVRMYKNANYEQFFVGGGVYRREDTSWAPLSGFQFASCTGGGKAALTTDPGCNQYAQGQDITNDGALWAPGSASVGTSWNTESSQLVTFNADSLPSRKYCSLADLSGYEYPKACNQSSSMTLSAFYPAGQFTFCSRVKNLTDMVVIQTTGGPGAGDTFYYMKGYGLVGFEATANQSTLQGGAGVSDVVFETSNRENVLFVPHLEETTELSALLQRTFAAKGSNTSGSSAADNPLQTKPHCEVLNTRSNPGDDLLGGQSTPVKGELKFKFRTSCDFGPARFDTEKYRLCREAGGTPEQCQEEATQSSTCTRNAQVAMSIYTKTPKINELWYRTVFGDMSIFKRLYPAALSNRSQILDIPAVTTAKYESLSSGDNVLAGDPANNRPGSSAQIFIPHLGGIYDYFLKGIQTALRPKGLTSGVITGVTTIAKQINCNQSASDPGPVAGLLSRDALINEFKNEFNGNHIRECYNDVVAKAKAAGYDPAFVMAIWIEESGASDYVAFPDVSDFGCIFRPHSDFNSQINCFLGLKASYSSPAYTACRPAGTLRMEDFLLIFSEGSRYACTPGDPCYRKFCLNSGFPARINSYYSRVSGGHGLPATP